jgi:hypothetical protein
MILATTQYVNIPSMIPQGVEGLKFKVTLLLLKVYHVIQIIHNEFDCDHKITYKSFPTLGIFDKIFISSNMGKTHVKPEILSHSQSNS